MEKYFITATSTYDGLRSYQVHVSAHGCLINTWALIWDGNGIVYIQWESLESVFNLMIY